MTRFGNLLACAAVSPHAQNERALLEWLYRTQLFGVKLGLENTRKLLGVLGLPLEGQKFFHVAGTNGKGSVCAFIHSLLKASQIQAGLFTSPHLVHFRERIQDGERTISAPELAKGLETLRKICQGWEPHPTFFELTFALGMDWFRKRGLEWAVLETGMGGRLDATNTMTPAVSVITTIHYDHQQNLGSTLREIATEKAGIIKPGVPVVTLKQPPEAMKVIADTARERESPLSIITTPLRGYQIGLSGQHQLWNATLAVSALKIAGFKLNEQILREGLKNVQWPARFQQFEMERLILDGAHNQEAAETLVRTWQHMFPGEKATMVFGAVRDKEMHKILRALQPIAARWEFTSFDSPRAAPAAQLHEIFETLYGGHMLCGVHETPSAALIDARRNPERVLVTGSLYLAGEVLAQLRGEKEWFQSSAQ